MQHELSPKEHKFCLAYLQNGNNGAQAYRDAGYNGNPDTVKSQAYKLLNMPKIKDFLHKHIDKVEKKLEITFEWKLKKLKQCIEASMVEDEETGQVLLENHNALLGAIAELNKMQGHYSAEKTHNLHLHAGQEITNVHVLIQQYFKEA
jgi:phage terminase small subunit